MNIYRGELVLVDYPYVGSSGSKIRPALIIQNDRDNQRRLNTILVQITGTTRRSLEPTQVLIEISTPEGQLSGLRADSVVNCVNIVMCAKDEILRKSGRLPPSLMDKVNAALKVALDLP